MAGRARDAQRSRAGGHPDDLSGPHLAGSDAIALFADRARRVDPHFALTAQTMPLVVRLVRQLDGMPLAIELAAAQLEALGMEQLLDRLADSPGLLAGGDRLAAARHRSLNAAVDWSYQLLGAEEQRAFRAVDQADHNRVRDVAGADRRDRVLPAHARPGRAARPARLGRRAYPAVGGRDDRRRVDHAAG
jgi:predicted ATPase